MNKSRISRIEEEKVFLVVDDFCDPMSIREFGVFRSTADAFITIAKQYYIKDFCWPVAARQELIRICRERQVLKKALDDSMCLIYDLGNRLTRGEL